MNTEEQEIIPEGKKGTVTTWGVKLDSETKNLVSTVMANSGLSGTQFIKAVCESFMNSKAIAAKDSLPEDLQFLDGLMARVRSFMLSQYTQYQEAKKQLKEDSLALVEEKEKQQNMLGFAIKEMAELKVKLEGTRKETEETKETLQKVEKHEEILMKKNAEMEKQLADLDLWKKQAQAAVLKDERIVNLEKSMHVLQAEVNKNHSLINELQSNNNDLKNKLERANGDIEKVKSIYESQIEKFEIEKKHMLEKTELEKRSAILDYLDKTKSDIPMKEEDFDEIKLLTLIREIEFERNTGNYLPIFYVREQLPKSIKREKFQKLLRSLRDSKQIRLSALQEGKHYTEEQIAQGIPQQSGGPLFYIIIKDLER